MTQDEIVIQLNSIVYALNARDNFLIDPYVENIEKALSAFEVGKIQFCLKKILEIYEIDYSNNAQDVIYAQMQEVDEELSSLKEKLAKEQESKIKLNRFWIALNEWLNDEANDPATLYRKDFHCDYQDFGNWFVHAEVDLNKEYRKCYGKDYEEIDQNNITFENVKEFIELYFDNIVEIQQGRLKFTVKVNKLLTHFHLPYKMKNGKLGNPKYKTTEQISQILNHEQFERKIKYAEEMILHNDFIDKHCALCYITDALDYFISLFDDKKEKSEKLYGVVAQSVNSDLNSHVYEIVKKEITFVRTITNDYFDVRHNEEKSKTKDHKEVKREILTDSIFVEYLYNRINSLLSLLRIKKDKELIKTDKTPEIQPLDIDDDALPF